MGMPKSFQARVWITIRRAQDLPGEWIAHCLDFDVVMQGRDPQHAFEMVKEGVGMVVIDDLEAGRDPRKRRAPEEYWEQLSAIMDKAEQVSNVGPLPSGQPGPVGYVVEIFFFAMKIEQNQIVGAMMPATPAPRVEAVYVLPEQRVA